MPQSDGRDEDHGRQPRQEAGPAGEGEPWEQAMFLDPPSGKRTNGHRGCRAGGLCEPMEAYAKDDFTRSAEKRRSTQMTWTNCG